MQQTHKKINKWKRLELKWFHDYSLFDDVTEDAKKCVFLRGSYYTKKSRIAVITEASWHKFQFSDNYNYILFTEFAWQETAKEHYGLWVKLPPAHLSTTVYCNKLRTNKMHNLKKKKEQSLPTLKMIDFCKNKCSVFILIYVNWQLTPHTACYLQTEKNALYSGLPIQSFVSLITVLLFLSLVGNRDLSIKQE